MPWFWTLLIFLCFTFSGNYNLSEAKKHQKQQKLSPAVVVGTVYCDTCFSQDFPKASHFIPGASVEVECKDAGSTQSFRREAKTDKNGQFKIDLPFSVSKHAKRINSCSIQLVKSNQQYCSVAATAKSSVLHLKSRKKGLHIFSAGFFKFKPLNQPDICDRRPSTNKESTNFLFEKDPSPIANPNDPTFLPPIHDPPSDDNNLPDLGRYLPQLPPLPQLPRLPGIPLLPPKTTPQPKDEKLATNLPMAFPFPPNPFNPIPNPFQPPPSIVPPIFPSPPPSLFPPLFPPINLPPVPGLIPSPPPPPPAFPIPLPPFPFIPVPGFPGVPPANKKSSEPKTKSVTP